MTDSKRSRLRSRRFAIVLLLVTVLPAATLVWLGLRILEQDRALATQRAAERRDALVKGVVGSLEQALVEAERYLVGGTVPDGMVRLSVTAAGVEAEPRDRVAWLPGPVAAEPIVDERFREGERLEYRGDELEALARYRQAGASPDAELRAGSLLRVARMHRRAGRLDEALRVYGDLARSSPVSVAGAPSDLHARRQACSIFESAGRKAELARAAAALEVEVLSGRWRLDEAAWSLTIDDLGRWLGRPVPVAQERRAVSRAADALWALVRSPAADATVTRSVMADDRTVTVLHRGQPDGLVALVVTATVVDEWIRVAMAGVPATTSIAIAGSGEGPLASTPEAAIEPALTVHSAESGLPWTLAIGTDGEPTAADTFGGRAELLTIGLASVLLIVVGGGYVLWRVMAREMAMARLQAEFVSAVSHEFRTPLTSLKHVTELLEERDDLEPGRRAAFYRALDRNTRRLQRLVESLLDFGRMQEGRKPYDLRPMDAGMFAGEVVSDFQATISRPNATIHLSVTCGTDLTIRADRTALATAVWNLLDNAVKYSGDRPVVHVTVRRHGPSVAIDVRDEGPGIPAEEQEGIFGRFVRGAEASERGVPGTGLGLAMVAHIVAAHGGSVSVVSKRGKGSTFTILLPADSVAVGSKRAGGAFRHGEAGLWAPASHGARGSGGTKSPGL